MAGNAIVNNKVIEQKIIARTDLTIRQLQPAFTAAKKRAFSKWLKSTFLNHPVTKEIQQGPSGSNTTDALGGYGNLFSFIGFSAGEDPIEPIVRYLQTEINKSLRIRHPRNSTQWTIIFSVPDLNGVAAASPMPWAAGRSWVVGIERGISGLGRYLYSDRASLYGSASGTAIQASKSLLGSLRNQSKMKPQSYMSAMLKTLTQEIKNEMSIELRRG
ncbi:MAG: hypothetical protein ACXADH_05415 [Candidatus Kariarchaeaceae archaeon]|jgi:hypothetical protein